MKKIFIFLCIAFLLTGCARHEAKFVGSRDTKDFFCDIETYQSEEKLVGDSELIILGTVGSALLVEENFGGEILYGSKIQVTVKEVIKGREDITNLYVLQSGRPNSDDYETKLKSGKKYLLFLNSKSFNGETVYDCTGIEQGIVEIKENGQLYSYADFGVSATLDGKAANTFKKQISEFVLK